MWHLYQSLNRSCVHRECPNAGCIHLASLNAFPILWMSSEVPFSISFLPCPLWLARKKEPRSAPLIFLKVEWGEFHLFINVTLVLCNSFIHLLKKYLYLLKQSCTVTFNRLAPNKGVLVCFLLYFCPVHILYVKTDKSFCG